MRGRIVTRVRMDSGARPHPTAANFGIRCRRPHEDSQSHAVLRSHPGRHGRRSVDRQAG